MESIEAYGCEGLLMIPVPLAATRDWGLHRLVIPQLAEFFDRRAA